MNKSNTYPESDSIIVDDAHEVGLEPQSGDAPSRVGYEALCTDNQC